MAARNRGTSSDMARGSFHFLWNGTLTAGVATAQLSPSGLASLSTRLLAMADEFAHFRVEAFKFRLHPQSGTGTQVAYYLGGVQDSPPVTVSPAAEVMSSVVRSQTTTVPTEWRRASASELRGALPWYKSVNGAADTTEETPGTLTVVGTGSDSFLLEAFIGVTFKTAVAPANTPVEIEARRAIREARLQAAIALERRALTRVLTGELPARAPAPLSGVPTASQRV